MGNLLYRAVGAEFLAFHAAGTSVEINPGSGLRFLTENRLHLAAFVDLAGIAAPASARVY
jgi:hypothetical protein